MKILILKWKSDDTVITDQKAQEKYLQNPDNTESKKEFYSNCYHDMKYMLMRIKKGV